MDAITVVDFAICAQCGHAIARHDLADCCAVGDCLCDYALAHDPGPAECACGDTHQTQDAPADAEAECRACGRETMCRGCATTGCARCDAIAVERSSRQSLKAAAWRLADLEAGLRTIARLTDPAPLNPTFAAAGLETPTDRLAAIESLTRTLLEGRA